MLPAGSKAPPSRSDKRIKRRGRGTRVYSPLGAAVRFIGAVECARNKADLTKCEALLDCCVHLCPIESMRLFLFIYFLFYFYSSSGKWHCAFRASRSALNLIDSAGA